MNTFSGPAPRDAIASSDSSMVDEYPVSNGVYTTYICSDSSMVDEYCTSSLDKILGSLVQIPLWSMNTLVPKPDPKVEDEFRFLYGR